MAQIPPCIGGHVIPSPQIPEIRPLPGLAKWRPTLTSPLLSLQNYKTKSGSKAPKKNQNHEAIIRPFAKLKDLQIFLWFCVIDLTILLWF